MFADNSLDNLVLETHGTSRTGESILRVDDEDQNIPSNNDMSHFITTGTINQFNSGNTSENVAQLQQMLNKITDGGRFILAACDVGNGDAGKKLGTALAKLSGNRLNIYMPTAFIHTLDAVTSNGPIRSLSTDFKVEASFGWLRTTPSGNFTNIRTLNLNPYKNMPEYISIFFSK